jgi:hypothetical protein
MKCNIMSFIALMMETARTSETSVYSNETTRRCIQQGFHLYTCRRQNLKSHNLNISCFAENSRNHEVHLR